MRHESTDELKIHLYIPADDFGYNLQIAWIQRLTGVVRIAEPVKFRERSKDEMGRALEPMMHLEHRDVQALYNALHQAGFRPSGEPADAAPGIIEAMKQHILDLRRSLFSKSAHSHEDGQR